MPDRDAAAGASARLGRDVVGARCVLHHFDEDPSPVKKTPASTKTRNDDAT
jgi:hypothetical protein